mgnify:CR=1 FL=1
MKQIINKILNKNKMNVIKNPKDNKIKIEATCAIVSRKPQDKDDEFKTAVIGFYNENNPHKKGLFPFITYEFTNIEKIRIKGLNISYYLEGNDLIINDLEELMIIREDTFLVLKGYQFEVERRKK